MIPSDLTLRVKALESLLIDKGLVDRAALDALVDNYEHKIGPRNGARVVARAWTDPAYKQRLLTDATAAIAELGYSGEQGEQMVVLENTSTIHNVVVGASRDGPMLLKTAIRTLKDCQPYAFLPAEKYREWKVLDLSFSPRDMAGG